MSLARELQEALEAAPLGSALPDFRHALDAALSRTVSGDAPALDAAIAAMPTLHAGHAALDAPVVRIGEPQELDEKARAALAAALRELHPWRKGPFDLFGIAIDSEWRSDLKWARVERAVAPLAGRRVLDVGCGNGYYAWRMLGAGADFVLGVDPAVRCLAQFRACKRFLPAAPVLLLPLGSEDLPAASNAFDTVFSMGVLYHRRDPVAHLRELRAQLRTGGELVLETLYIEDGEEAVLAPGGRYAKMRNVWAIPRRDTLLGWLAEAGFDAARIVSTSITSTAEQRRTEWMRFESLADFLDPADPSHTVEGHPAPRRVIAIATAGA